MKQNHILIVPKFRVSPLMLTKNATRNKPGIGLPVLTQIVFRGALPQLVLCWLYADGCFADTKRQKTGKKRHKRQEINKRTRISLLHLYLTKIFGCNGVRKRKWTAWRGCYDSEER